MEKGRRTKRMGVMIQREIANLILKGVRDPRLEGVTITHVLVTEDLSEAKVYFFIPQNRDLKEVMKGFESAKGFFRSEIGEHIKSRKTPALKFFYDDSLDFFEKLKNQEAIKI